MIRAFWKGPRPRVHLAFGAFYRTAAWGYRRKSDEHGAEVAVVVSGLGANEAVSFGVEIPGRWSSRVACCLAEARHRGVLMEARLRMGKARGWGHARVRSLD